jgi:hypothetical protein
MCDNTFLNGSSTRLHLFSPFPLLIYSLPSPFEDYVVLWVCMGCTAMQGKGVYRSRSYGYVVV